MGHCGKTNGSLHLLMTVENNDLTASPRRNSALPHSRGEFETLVEGLDYAAQGETGFTFYFRPPFGVRPSMAQLTRPVASTIRRGGRLQSLPIVPETLPLIPD